MLLTEKEFNETKEQFNQYQQKYSNMREAINEYLNMKFAKLAKPFKIEEVHCSIEDPHYYEPDSKYSIEHIGLAYFTDDPEEIKHNCKYDFGSEMNIRITSERIYVSPGCCGEYSDMNKYQVARVHFLSKLFNDEDEIVSTINKIIDLEVLKTHKELYHKILQHENEIERQKKEQEKKQFDIMIKDSVGKVIVSYYCKGSERIQDDDDRHYKRTMVIGDPSSRYTINKVTPKRVYCSFKYNDNSSSSYSIIFKRDELFSEYKNNEIKIVAKDEKYPETFIVIS